MAKSDDGKNAEAARDSLSELLLTGPNTELLSVRISKGLHHELEQIAKKSKRQLPEVVREMLWFHAFPANLKSRIQDAKQKTAGGPNEAGALFFLSLAPQLAMYQHQADKVLESCAGVKEIEKRALELKAKLELLEAEAKAEWLEFMEVVAAPE